MKKLTEKELSDLPLSSILKLYQEAAEAHGVHSYTGEYKKVNIQYHRLVSVYKELKRRGLEAQKSLLALIESNVLSVKVWAAFHALDFAPEVAEPVLNDIVKNCKGIQRLDAEIVLKEWKSGNLKFDV